MPSTPMRGILRVSQAAAALEHTGDDEVHVDFPVIRDHAPTKRRQICSACLVQEVSHWRLARGAAESRSATSSAIFKAFGLTWAPPAGGAPRACPANDAALTLMWKPEQK